MVEKHRELKVFIPENEVENYLHSLNVAAKSKNYSRLEDIEKIISEDNTLDYDYICFQTPRLHFGNQYYEAIIWLSVEKKAIVLRNITSCQRSFLSISEYNQILESFYNEIISNVKIKGVKKQLTKSVLEIEDVLGKKTAEALMKFSNWANKDSNLVHDSDFRFWADFVKLAYRTHARMNAEQLEIWLKQNGWTEKYAVELAKYYQYSLDLLKYV